MEYTKEVRTEAGKNFIKKIENDIENNRYDFLKYSHKLTSNFEIVKGDPVSIKLTFELKANQIDILEANNCFEKKVCTNNK